MCENISCDYPADEKKAQLWLGGSQLSLQQTLKELTGIEKAWIKGIYEKIRDGEGPKKLCSACIVRCFVSSLILNSVYNSVEKTEQTSKDDIIPLIILEWGLNAASKIAVIQHGEAVFSDAEKKLKKSSGGYIESFPNWLAMRIKRPEYKQPQNLTKDERAMMLMMRRSGSSMRELKFIFDRSLSTIHAVCRNVEPIKTYEHYDDY